jgi:hypothetical protein
VCHRAEHERRVGVTEPERLDRERRGLGIQAAAAVLGRDVEPEQARVAEAFPLLGREVLIGCRLP